MANFHTFYVSAEGVAKTGLSPTWQTLKNVDDGSNYAQPAITEVGGGWYKYTLDLADFKHVVGVVDAGAALTVNADRYINQDLSYTKHSQKAKKDVVVAQVYDEDTDALTFFALLLVNGEQITTGLTSVTIVVYDESDNQQFSINTNSFNNGVAVLSEASPTLTKNKGYYAIVSLVDSVETIQSAVIYMATE